MKIRIRPRIETKFEDIGRIAEEIAKIRSVRAVYLFGSYATGKNNSFSDIDICVIGNLNEKERHMALSPLSDNLNIVFFDVLPIHIKFMVFKEGKPLIIKDKEFLDFEKFKTLQEYLDFKRVLDRYVFETLGVKNA
jgi:predicted nucleotidyltransferase